MAKSSVYKLQHMMFESEELFQQEESLAQDEQALKHLLALYLKKQTTSEGKALLRAFENGAALTGKNGLRKKLGAIHLEFFGRAYFPHYFTRTSPEFHQKLDTVWQRGVMKNENPLKKAKQMNRMSGVKRVVAAPRGHAKSTNLTFKDTLHAVLYEYKHYPILISDSTEQAEGFLDNLRVELEENEAIREDFGDLVGDVWRSGVLLTKTNIKIEAIGSGKKIRGRKHRNFRPDLIVLDDVENDENVRTSDQRKKLENWFYKAVSKSGDDYTDIIYIGTLLHYDSLLAKTLRNPAYQAMKVQAILSFSEREDLWEHWEALYVDLDNPNRELEALAFFEGNKEEMLKGTHVLWEDKLDYYQLMVMKVSEGAASFNSEMQNEPIDPNDCLFQEDWLAFYNEVEIDFSDEKFTFYGFVDPSLGKSKNSDFSAILTLAKDKETGLMYVLDADVERRHPDKIIQDVLEKERWLKSSFGRGYTKFGAETNRFQWFLAQEIKKASAKAGLYLPLEEVVQTKDKVLRVQTLQPDIKNKYIHFNHRHKRLLEQLLQFPMGSHDDAVDALEGVRTIAKKASQVEIQTYRSY